MLHRPVLCWLGGGGRFLTKIEIIQFPYEEMQIFRKLLDFIFLRCRLLGYKSREEHLVSL